MNEYLEIGYQIIVFLSIVVTAATVLAKYTKTKKDDEFLAKAHKWLSAIADLKKPEK